jgi:hypothetical protein
MIASIRKLEAPDPVDLIFDHQEPNNPSHPDAAASSTHIGC